MTIAWLVRSGSGGSLRARAYPAVATPLARFVMKRLSTFRAARGRRGLGDQRPHLDELHRHALQRLSVADRPAARPPSSLGEVPAAPVTRTMPGLCRGAGAGK